MNMTLSETLKKKSKYGGLRKKSKKRRKSTRTRKSKKTKKINKATTRKNRRGGEENIDIIPVLDTCPICMDEIQPGENKTITACNHIFHTVCLERWVRRATRRNDEPTCPMCRAPIEMNVSGNPNNDNYVIENLHDSILNDNSDESFLRKVSSLLMDKEVMEFIHEQGSMFPLGDNRRFSKLLADIFRRTKDIRVGRGMEWYNQNSIELQETLRYYKQVLIQGTPENIFFNDSEYSFQRNPHFDGFIEYMNQISSNSDRLGGTRKTRKKRNHNRGIIV